MTSSRSSITVRQVSVLDLSGDELARCRHLTYPKRGLMRRCLAELVEKRPERAERSVALLAEDENEQILGWALLFENRFGRVESYYFVASRYRRQGIGRRLAEEVRRLRPRHKVLVRPHDGASYAFFANFPRFVPQGAPNWLAKLKREAEELVPVSG